MSRRLVCYVGCRAELKQPQTDATCSAFTLFMKPPRIILAFLVFWQAHCDCRQWGLATGRNAPRTGVRSVASVPAAVPAAVAVAPAAAAAAVAPATAAAAVAPAAAAAATAAVAPATARSRSRSREGRRYTRSKIVKALQDQWRYLAVADRPMPPSGRADSGLVPGATWGEALRTGRAQTEELLRQDPSGYHSSVHLSLYLQWAAVELRAQRSSAAAGLELGRHIQQFLS